MQNSPELDGKYLGTITKDFVKIANTLKEASYQLRVRSISNYPIFAIAKHEISIGQLLIGREEADLAWNYYFSFAEEFVQRQLIEETKIEEFEQAYRNPDEYCCLFVIDKEFVNFVFLPFPEEDDDA